MADNVRNEHDVEVRKENAKEIYVILKAIQFREVYIYIVSTYLSLFSTELFTLQEQECG